MLGLEPLPWPRIRIQTCMVEWVALERPWYGLTLPVSGPLGMSY